MANTIPRTRCPLSSALSSPATLHALIAVVLLISVVFSATNNVILNSPQEGFITNSSSVEFNYTVTTFKPSDKVKCNLMVDEKSKKSETFQYATAYQASETVKLTDAQHKVYVKCEFPSKEILNSEKANFTVVSRPIITLASPAKNWYPDPDYNNSTATDDFSYNVYFYSLSPGASNTNTGVSSRSCKFVIDKALVERETVLDNYTNSEAIAVSSIPRFEGKHKWQVICTDTNGAVGKSEKRNFRHRQKITIVPVTQRNAQFNSADDIALKFNAISTKKLECRVTVDGVEGEKMKLKANTNSQKVFTYRTSVVNPTEPHSWNVFCKSGNNVVISDIYSFTVGPL